MGEESFTSPPCRPNQSLRGACQRKYAHVGGSVVIIFLVAKKIKALGAEE